MNSPNRSQLRYPTRREVLALGIGAFVVAAVPFARSRRRLIRRSVPMMGTVAEIGVVHRDPTYAHAAIDAALEELELVNRLMTRFSQTSDIGRANRLATTNGVRVSPATAAVLRDALEWAVSSEGAFDPCLGKAVRLWDVGQRSTPPGAHRFRRLAGRRLYRSLDLDTGSGQATVRFTDPDVELDLGGIAKGYGVDRAVQTLRAWGINHGLVNVGGDLYALGESQDGDPWKVGIRSPRDPGRLSGSVEVRDAAVATSGDYLQYFRYQGRQYHHLLDPTTGAPRRSPVHGVTVTASSCMTADAAATAVFGMAHRDAERVLRNRAPDARIVSTI